MRFEGAGQPVSAGVSAFYCNGSDRAVVLCEQPSGNSEPSGFDGLAQRDSFNLAESQFRESARDVHMVNDIRDGDAFGRVQPNESCIRRTRAVAGGKRRVLPLEMICRGGTTEIR